MQKFNILLISVILIGFHQNSAQSICSKNQETKNDVAFIRLGKFRGFDGDAEYQKTYFLSRYFTATWIQAKQICSAFGLELASFETALEAYSFLSICETNVNLKGINNGYVIVDGMTLTPKSNNDWYWTNSGNKISYPITWARLQPDNYNNIENCISIGRTSVNYTMGFNDYPCNSDPRQFVCQRVDFYIY